MAFFNLLKSSQKQVSLMKFPTQVSQLTSLYGILKSSLP